MILKWVAADQPLWRVRILVRKLLGLLGVEFIRRRKFDRKHSKLLAEIEAAGSHFL